MNKDDLDNDDDDDDDDDDPYYLQRFLDAQNYKSKYDEACGELREGEKIGHWMWFIFPQIVGLGYSAEAIKFGITSLEEAEAYLNHPVLGRRLRRCTKLVNLIEGRSIEQIFGDYDSLKFRSCMTLFAQTSGDNEVFKRALKKYFGGKYDSLTLKKL